MGHDKVSKHWNENAAAWIEASKNGYDIWRDRLNTPAFLDLLPNIKKSIGLDIGCGDGHNSKRIAAYCKKLISIDISDKLLNEAKQDPLPSNLVFQKENAAQLSFNDNYFDFVVATMSFMDMADMDKVLSEINRVLTPSGFLQFSIIHPCFNEHKGEWIVDDLNNSLGFLMKDYFVENQGEIHEWKHKKSPENTKPFRVPRYSKPLNAWINLLFKNGFYIETLIEPYADDKTIDDHPELISTRVVAHSLIVRCRKHQKENFNDKILRQLPGNVWWKNKDLVYLGCNDGVLKALDYDSSEQFIGKKDHDLWPAEIADKLVLGDLEVLTTGRAVTLEEVILSGNEKKIMLTNKSPIFNENKQIILILGISTDITDRKKMEEELRIAKEAAEAANHAKTEFIANMGHDIRTPLTGIIGMSYILEDEVQGKDEKEHVNIIHQSGEQLLGLLNGVLDLITVDATNEDMVLHESFDVRRVIRDVTELECSAVEAKHLSIKTHVDEAIPSYVVGDKIKLHRILLNLTGNAVKFTKVGHIEINAELQSLENNQAKILFSVKDTGIGIPSELQNKVFDRFFKVSPSYKGLYAGNGIGLHIAHKYVDLMQGNIQLTSEIGVGTTFSFVLPMKIGQAPAEEINKSVEAALLARGSTPISTEPLDFFGNSTVDESCFGDTVLKSSCTNVYTAVLRSDSSRNSSSAASFRRSLLLKEEITTSQPIDLSQFQVLLVEDNVTALNVLKIMVKKFNVQISVAMDAETALELVKKQHFDLIITDLGLPQKSGDEMTAVIRAYERDNGLKPMKIVGLTGHALGEITQTCLHAGMNEVYLKPMLPETLKKLINSLLVAKNEKSIEKPKSGGLLGMDLPDTEEQLFEIDAYPLLDLEVGIQVTGSEDILHDIYSNLKEQGITADLAIIQKAHESGDWKTVEKYTHKMKGGACYGTVRLYYALLYMERYLKAGHSNCAERLYTQMLRVIDETVIYLEANF